MQPVERKDLIVKAGRCLCCLGSWVIDMSNVTVRRDAPFVLESIIFLVHVPAEGASVPGAADLFRILQPQRYDLLSVW